MKKQQYSDEELFFTLIISLLIELFNFYFGGSFGIGLIYCLLSLTKFSFMPKK